VLFHLFLSKKTPNQNGLHHCQRVTGEEKGGEEAMAEGLRVGEEMGTGNREAGGKRWI
jgi:hypothetical protein